MEETAGIHPIEIDEEPNHCEEVKVKRSRRSWIDSRLYESCCEEECEDEKTLKVFTMFFISLL